MSELITVNEAAALLGISGSAVRLFIADGSLDREYRYGISVVSRTAVEDMATRRRIVTAQRAEQKAAPKRPRGRPANTWQNRS
ncbi:MAG: hypothetical protein EB117_12835 [Betaproteobacteria bacterium]|nr:hypothetical protein [Betaproteobacteria bacterium]